MGIGMMRGVALGVALVVGGSLAGCGKSEPPTFVQVRQAMQWIVDHECDRSGGQKGYPGYGGKGMGVALVTFVCDNGKVFEIRLQDDETYKVTRTSP